MIKELCHDFFMPVSTSTASLWKFLHPGLTRDGFFESYCSFNGNIHEIYLTHLSNLKQFHIYYSSREKIGCNISGLHVFLEKGLLDFFCLYDNRQTVVHSIR
ncbi:uncharacterized protein LOC119651034 [Hermetia illucens]|uniref:uncharacterized protein LOC119651034 n=1 Tax=Hermetia illucens TaxID=343691 RepID=UPI0018CBF256|nr:uncharacterized protein LOC119651034 [Hermetia illucens]